MNQGIHSEGDGCDDGDGLGDGEELSAVRCIATSSRHITAVYSTTGTTGRKMKQGWCLLEPRMKHNPRSSTCLFSLLLVVAISFCIRGNKGPYQCRAVNSLQMKG